MAGSRQEEQRVLRVAPFEIDLERHEATLEVGSERHTLVLTLTEFKLLAHCARAAARVQPRRADGHLPAGRRRAGAHGGQPRQQAARKLDDLGVQGVPVSVRGVGYKLWS